MRPHRENAEGGIEGANVVTEPTRQLDTGQAVEHLSDYYKHLASLSAGAIVVIGAFAERFQPAGGATSAPPNAIGFAIFALSSLAFCILLSTGMMWSYGVARRQAAGSASAPEVDAWAYDVDSRALTTAKLFVRYGSLVTPAVFVAGFLFLAAYAAVLLL
jgi:hypothetical protein